MNETLQIFIYIVGGALIIFVAIFTYMAFVVIKTMQSVRKVTDNIDLVKEGINIVQQGAKVGALTIISKILGVFKGGDERGKR